MNSQASRLRALLVDDEMLARDNLELMLSEFCPEVEVVGKAGGVEEALDQIGTKSPDVVFLDIRMPSGSEGFDLLDRLEKRDFQVVFVTAFKDYAIRALNASAVHYMLKPVDIEDLKHAVSKLVDMHEAIQGSEQSRELYAQSIDHLRQNIRSTEPPRRLTLYHNKGFRIVEVDSIVRLEAADSCTRFFFDDGSDYLDTKTLRVYDELLQGRSFARVHKSHMINLDHLKEYDNREGHFVQLSDGSRVPVARAKLSWFLSLVKRI